MSASPPAGAVDTVTIGVDHPALAGHFPGRPIVPGVVLLDEAIASIGRARGAAPSSLRLASVKFLHPVVPPARLQISHREHGAAFEFSISDGTRTVASGRIDAIDPTAVPR